jgi:hypothetical protein
MLCCTTLSAVWGSADSTSLPEDRQPARCVVWHTVSTYQKQVGGIEQLAALGGRQRMVIWGTTFPSW